MKFQERESVSYATSLFTPHYSLRYPLQVRYGLRSADSVLKHVEELSADVQKFANKQGSVPACEPKSVIEDQVLLIAVAVHVGKCETMSFDHKNFGPLNWIGFVTWLIWWNHPKWMRITARANDDDVSATVDSRPNNASLD